MTLTAAYKACENGAFVSNTYFDPEQSMHCWRGNFYYEDGPRLNCNGFFLAREPWAKDGWYIKVEAYQVDKKILDKLHMANQSRKKREINFEEALLITV